MKITTQIALALPLMMAVACGNKGGAEASTDASAARKEQRTVPAFNADSAYSYVAAQMAFGSRVPGTPTHAQTAEWLAAELRRHGAEVIVQDAPVTAFDGTRLQAKNIIGQFNPDSKERVLLLAHWDARPFADQDADEANRRKAVPAANDGASGVGVLLEIARLLGQNDPGKGVDILFVDAEDYGAPDWATVTGSDDTWALGTQYWARRPHRPAYRPRYAILLDMVGAKDATFYKEGFSNHYAPSLVDKVWKRAQELGYGNYFINENGGYINDDHYYVNTMARIPSIDIIHLDPESPTGFYPYWHTMGDTLDKIDPATLNAVGHTVTDVIYND
jgi:Zn-dependent M28 family amino/carboxypeptidase